MFVMPTYHPGTKSIGAELCADCRRPREVRDDARCVPDLMGEASRRMSALFAREGVPVTPFVDVFGAIAGGWGKVVACDRHWRVC